MLKIVFVPVLLIALLGASLIWSGESRVSRADFAFINRGDNMSLDLNDMSYMQDIRLAYALWEGLYTLNPADLQPILGTADSVQVSPDQRVWTLHIRPTARWSNGDPVKAQDFLFEWRRMLESPKEYTYLHYYIRGAKAYEEAYADYAKADQAHKPPLPDFSAVGEQQLDDQTVRITLIDPVPFFPALLAFPAFFPMHERSMQPFLEVDPVTGQKSYKPVFTQPPNLLTNGPYRLAEWAFHRRVRMIASDYYWNKAVVKSRVIDQIHADYPEAAYRLYQQGDADWLADVDGDIAAALLKQLNRPDLHVFPAFGTYFYELNCNEKLPDGTPNPLHDPRVRQALAMSIDKEPIVRDVGRLNQPVASTFIPLNTFPGYHSPPGITYDPKGARRLLADAGYPEGHGFPAISILYNTEGNHADIATIVRHQWMDTLGITVDPHGEEGSQYRKDLHGHNFTVSRAGWFGDYNDPSTFTDKYLSTSDNNAAAFNDRRYDQLCAAAAVEADPAKRFALLSQAEDRLLAEAPIIPLYTQVGAYLFRENVKGLPLNAQQMQMFETIHVVPKGE
jgi:oligopeptide transport system substrate-binding protein